MNTRLDIYIDGEYIGTHTNASIALNAILDEIEIECDNNGFDYPTINEELLLETIEDILENGGEEHIYVDNTIVGVDTGEFADFHIDLCGGIDMF